MRNLGHLVAWMIKHEAHGLSLDTLIYLPDGVLPGDFYQRDWVRVSWLDEPEFKE